MKSTPMQQRAFYLPGHEKNPIIKAGKEPEVIKFVGVRNVGGFNFTDGAMSLYLERYKCVRQANFLLRFHNVSSEVLQDVDVPTRSQTFSPKSESQGILGLVGEDAPQSAEGQPANGTADASAGAPGSTPHTPSARTHGQRRTGQGSSVASKTPVDAATRERLLGGGPSADTVKSADVKSDGADGLT